MKSVMDQICRAKELFPLKENEIREVVEKIIEYHQKAYQWTMNADHAAIVNQALKSGVLLRTKLRTAIEMLDQIYQYGTVDQIKTIDVTKETYEEDDHSNEQSE